MHAYRAIQNGDVDTVAIVYGNNQLSASGRTLGTGGGGGGRGGMAMPLPMAYEFPIGPHARRRVRDGGAAPHARVRHDARAARVDRGADPRARGAQPATRCTATRSRSTTCSVSKLVADPLHKLDCCVISDGGCCIILTTEDRARDLAHRPVYVRGAAGGTTHHSIAAMADMTRTAAAVSGPKAFADAGITPADVDMFAMYDSFTYTVLVVLEDLGFAPKGEGGAFVTDNGGNLRLGGALPTNTDGGGLSATHPGMRGLFLLCEATRQLRGEAGDSQVAGRGDRGRARQRRVAVDAGNGRARHGGGTEWRMTVRNASSPTTGSTGTRARSTCGRGRPTKTASSGKARGRGELRIQHCTTCGKHQHYAALPLQSTAAPTRSSGSPRAASATVYSFTVIRQNGVPPFNERVPFVVATVDLDEDGRAHDRARCRARARRRADRHAGARRVPARQRRVGLVDFARARLRPSSTEASSSPDPLGVTIETASLASSASTSSGVRPGEPRSRSYVGYEVSTPSASTASSADQWARRWPPACEAVDELPQVLRRSTPSTAASVPVTATSVRSSRIGRAVLVPVPAHRAEHVAQRVERVADRRLQSSSVIVRVRSPRRARRARPASTGNARRPWRGRRPLPWPDVHAEAVRAAFSHQPRGGFENAGTRGPTSSRRVGLIPPPSP